MENLEKKSYTYMQILFAIWQAIDFCAEAFWYCAPETVFDMDVDWILKDDITTFQIRVPRAPYLPYLRRAELKSALQLYLNYATPAEIRQPPYITEKGTYNCVESLFVEYVGIDPLDTSNYLISVMLLTDPTEYRYIKALKRVPQI